MRRRFQLTCFGADGIDVNVKESVLADLETFRLETRDWLAGPRMTLADIAGAAHVSVIDYFGDAPWREYPAVKTWYSKIKSRPSFRPLLHDRWPGMQPAGHYDDLDF